MIPDNNLEAAIISELMAYIKNNKIIYFYQFPIQKDLWCVHHAKTVPYLYYITQSISTYQPWKMKILHMPQGVIPRVKEKQIPGKYIFYHFRISLRTVPYLVPYLLLITYLLLCNPRTVPFLHYSSGLNIFFDFW